MCEKKRYLIGIALIAVLLVVGCSGKTEPEEVVNRFITAINNGDESASDELAHSYFPDSQEREAIAYARKTIEGKKLVSIKEMVDIRDGGIAYVFASFRDGTEVRFILVYNKGRWRISGIGKE